MQANILLSAYIQRAQNITPKSGVNADALHFPSVLTLKPTVGNVRSSIK